jgi:DNA-directed RNA polymerase subunit E'/Rpb7
MLPELKYHDNYLKEEEFEEILLIHPKFLDSQLKDNIKIILQQKYPICFKDKGYVFNIKNISILDNVLDITPLGQIKCRVGFVLTLYQPKVGHVFQFRALKKSPVGEKYWVEIKPLIIFINNTMGRVENDHVDVIITNVKTDNTLCFGSVQY